MEHAVTVALIGISVVLSGCGPSAQEPSELLRRACDMYADADGGLEHDLAFWVEAFNKPAEVALWEKLYAEDVARVEARNMKKIAEVEARNAREFAMKPKDFTPEVPTRLEVPKPTKTPQERAESQFAYEKKTNETARQVVSLRLAISLREVDEALKKCRESSVMAKYSGK